MAKRNAWRTGAVGALCAGISSLAPLPSRAASSSSISLDHLLENQLRAAEGRLQALCEPECGTVVLEGAAREAITAEARPITHDATLVRYDGLFMQRMRDAYGDSVTYFILAHEYGHHLDRGTASTWTHELRADALAGCALVRDGRPLGPSLAWMRHEHFIEMLDEVLGDPMRPEAVLAKYAESHPPWIYRIDASRRGAELCVGNTTLVGLLAGISDGPAPEEESARSVLAAAPHAWRTPEPAERAVATPLWGVLAQSKGSRF
jgi:hypothetical protein